MQRSAFEVESSDSNFQVRGREGSCRARLKERNTQRGEERGESGGLLEGGVRGTVTGVGVVESCGRIRCPFPGKSRRSIETCIMAAIIHFLSDRGDLLYGGCSVHAFLSVAPCIDAYVHARATFYPLLPNSLATLLHFFHLCPRTTVAHFRADSSLFLSFIIRRSDRARICPTNDNKWDGDDWEILEEIRDRTNEATI